MERTRGLIVLGLIGVLAAGAAAMSPHETAPDEIVFFQSGDLKLRGKLVTPDAPGPHPLLVLVHGSEQFSAVDNYPQPAFFAKNGFAVFVFDKRGTGESEGGPTLSFVKLAGDVAAATKFARTLPGVDPEHVGLVAYSQGGWVAPMAARLDDGISFLLINYGPAVSQAAEDTWSTLATMRQNGRSDAEMEDAKRLIASVHDIIQARLESGWESMQKKVEQYRQRPWFDEIASTESNTAFFIHTPPEQLKQMFAAMDPDGEVDFNRDPLIVLRQLDIPVHWIFGGRDQSMPTEESVKNLQTLIDDEKKPVTIRVFPNADHGIVELVEKNGITKQQSAEGYHEAMIQWLKEQVQ